MKACYGINKMVESGVLNRLLRKYHSCELVIVGESDLRIKIAHKNMLVVLGRMIDRQRLKLRSDITCGA